MSDAWKLTRDQVKCAQKWQNMHNDQKARPSQLLTGDRVFLYRPAAEKIEEGWKLVRPYHGPYWIIELTVNKYSNYEDRQDTK